MQKLFLRSSGTLLHQQYNAAHGLPYKTSCGPWSNLSLRPCPKHTTVHTFFSIVVIQANCSAGLITLFCSQLCKSKKCNKCILFLFKLHYISWT